MMCNSSMPLHALLPGNSLKSDEHAAEQNQENHTSEEWVHASESRLLLALDAACMGVWDWNVLTDEMSWSAWHYALFGLDIKEATGTYQEFDERVHPEDRAGLQLAVQKARETGAEYRHEYRIVWPDGSIHWVAGHGRFFYDVEGNAMRMTGVLMDATERHWLQTQMEAQMTQVQAAFRELEANRLQLEQTNARLAEANSRLEELATTDELTGLKNKRAFTAFLDQEYQEAVRYHRPLSVILLDADKFKQINDNCGHPAGDAVLRRMGELLQSHKRQIDLVARFGGEEFVYVLPDTDRSGATAVAERIRIALETFPWPEHPVTASFGVATGVATHAGSEELVVQADQALYRSKRRGRNCVTHFADLP